MYPIISTNIYKPYHFYHLTTVFPISPLDFPPMNTCQPKMISTGRGLVQIEVVRMRWEATGLFEKISFRKNRENLHSRKLTPEDPKIWWFGKGISFQQFGNVWCPAVCFRGCMAKKTDIWLKQEIHQSSSFFHSGEQPTAHFAGKPAILLLEKHTKIWKVFSPT